MPCVPAQKGCVLCGKVKMGGSRNKSQHKSIEEMENSTDTIARFYSDDHDRLDGLFATYRRLKDTQAEKAKEAFGKFKIGLEQHMAWEEAILFSEYNVRAKLTEEDSETVDLLAEHEQIRDYVEAVWSKAQKSDSRTGKEVDRLSRLLTEHNVAEEKGIYPKLDALLTTQELARIHQQMKDAAFG